MYSVDFIFEPGKYDSEFHALDNSIKEIAESMDGCKKCLTSVST